MAEKHKEPFRILALDGGGVKAIFSAKLLDLISKQLNIGNIAAKFDLIVGTSAGSIVAGALCTNIPLPKFIDSFKEAAPKIFRKKWWRHGWLTSRFNIQVLEKFLQKEFSEITMGEITHPLIINATNMSQGEVFVIKSIYQKQYRPDEYERDGNIPLYRAILASCAAPTYFDPVLIGGHLLCDGAVWANNPALVGYIEAQKTFGIYPFDKETQRTQIKILSIGTDNQPVRYQESISWGIFCGWKTTKLANFFMANQTQIPTNMLQLVMPDEDFLRIQPDETVSKKIGLENYEFIPILEKEARQVVQRHARQIANLMME